MKEQNQLNQQSNSEDKLSRGLQVLSFIIPIIGIIIYFSNKRSNPKKEKSALNAGLLGIFIGGLINILARFVIG